MKATILTIGLLVFGLFGVQAQKEFNKGYVKLELTDISSDNAEMAAGLEMMKGMTMETFFNPTETLTKMNMMGGMMETTTLVNNKSKDMLMLFNMMGQKIKVTGNQAKMQDEKVDEMAKEVKLIEFRDDTKTISGYKCYKVEIDINKAQNMSMVAYVTEEIKAPTNSLQGLENVKLKGFPLEFTMSMGGMMNMTYTAVEVSEKLDESVFKLNTDGYKEMTMEEFQKSMGGMSGGLGF